MRIARTKRRPSEEPELASLTRIMRGRCSDRVDSDYHMGQTDPYLGNSRYRSYNHKEFRIDAYGRRDAAAEISKLAEQGIDCSSALPLLIECLEKESAWFVQSNAAKAIENMALFGTDCSSAIPALEKLLDVPQTRIEAERAFKAIKASKELCASCDLRYSTDYMKGRLTEIVQRFDALGMGSLGTVVVADAKTLETYFRVGKGNFRMLYYPFNAHVDLSAPLDYNKTSATAHRNWLYGRILLWSPSTSPESAEFENTLIHEFTHLSSKLRRALRHLERQWRSQASEKDGRKYLVRIINEGLATFTARYARSPDSLDSDRDSLTRSAESKVNSVTRMAGAGDGWPKMWLDMNYRNYSYDIGLNFFLQVHEVLQGSPSDYADLLLKNPLSVREVLSVDGGRAWAEWNQSIRARRPK